MVSSNKARKSAVNKTIKKRKQPAVRNDRQRKKPKCKKFAEARTSSRQSIRLQLLRRKGLSELHNIVF